MRQKLCLGKPGSYEIYYRCINTLQFGLPQSRPRVYIVGIRRDKLEKPFRFPEPSDPSLTIDLVLDPVDSDDDPGRLPSNGVGKKNVRAALRTFSPTSLYIGVPLLLSYYVFQIQFGPAPQAASHGGCMLDPSDLVAPTPVLLWRDFPLTQPGGPNARSATTLFSVFLPRRNSKQYGNNCGRLAQKWCTFLKLLSPMAGRCQVGEQTVWSVGAGSN